MNRDDRPLVLIVDDDPTVRLLAGATLEQAGFSTVEADDGQQALSVYDDIQPDVVLLDVNLPGRDGFAVCAELRRRGQQTPVLMMTGGDDVAAIERAFDAGATDFIGKPLNWTLLGHRLRYMLRASRAMQELILLATAVEQADEAIVVTDTDGTIQYVNPAFERTTGYAREDVLGDTPRLLKSGTHDDAFYAGLWSCLTRGEVWQGLLVNRRKDGALLEEECSISPVRDGSGAIARFVAVKRDVTLERTLARQLAEAQRLEALGTLAGGIAHDFNNLLTPMICHAEMALEKVSPQSAPERHIAKVLGAAERARDLIQQILAFSRQGECTPSPTAVSPIVEEVLGLLRASTPQGVELRSQRGLGSDVALAEPTQIRQVLINLCTNALHAMKGRGGLLAVGVEGAEVRDAESPHPDLAEGDYVRLSVTDTGHGMEPGVMERIFEPFFTTKQPGEGTGIGLAASHGIVRRHGGAITVRSSPGQGATFDVYLPRAKGAEEAPPRTDGWIEAGSGRVLLVDDEEMLRAVGQDILEDLGFTVETSAGGVSALNSFRTDPYRYDAVITDLSMPGMTGVQLAQELLALRPEVPIVLCTGFSEAITAEGAAELGIREFLMKPWNRLQLSAALQRAMRPPRG